MDFANLDAYYASLNDFSLYFFGLSLNGLDMSIAYAVRPPSIECVPSYCRGLVT